MEKTKTAASKSKSRRSQPNGGKTPFAIDARALKKLRLVAVVFSHVEREWFPTEEAYQAEREVEDRAQDVVAEIEKLGIPVKAYPGNQYLMPTLLVDKPDLVVNLVDTLRGKDALQTSVPAALELGEIPYTGTEMQGLVIGNNRNLFKQLLVAYAIPTPPYQFITRVNTVIQEDLGLPLIVKLNEGGGSVGIDNKAVKETREDAQAQVELLIKTYSTPVIVEQFINGPEITAVVVEDSRKRHVFLAQKVFHHKPDGKYEFTSLESYEHKRAYTYTLVEEPLANKIRPLVTRAFKGLLLRDYAKFDIRVDASTQTPYFTDCNPNTAFGPDPGLPFTEVLGLHKVSFQDALASLLSKHARQL